MWPNPQSPADLVTFTEEIFNGKLHFLCSVYLEIIGIFCLRAKKLPRIGELPRKTLESSHFNAQEKRGLSDIFEASQSSEASSEICWTSKIELFAKIVNSLKPLTIFAKSSMLDVWFDFEYTSEVALEKIYMH